MRKGYLNISTLTDLADVHLMLQPGKPNSEETHQNNT